LAEVFDAGEIVREVEGGLSGNAFSFAGPGATAALEGPRGLRAHKRNAHNRSGKSANRA
jgi:hypothetical protein